MRQATFFLLFLIQSSSADHLPTDAHPSAQIPTGFTMEVFADANQVENVTTIAIDEQNRVYAGETHRWRIQVQEIREGGPNGRFLSERVKDDISCMTTQDRIALHKKWSGKLPAYLRWDQFTADAERIRLLEDRDGDGKADQITNFRDDFNEPLAGPSGGLIARDGTVYFSMIPGVYALKDMDGDGKAEEVKTLIDGFGCRISFSGHDMNGFAWGPDGKLYWSIGDRGYHVEADGKTFSRPDSGAIFRANPDGSDFEEFHINLRNPKEIAFDQYGNLFTVDNNYDNGDRARIVYVMEHGDSGWRMGHQTMASFGKQVFPHLADTGGDRNQALDLWMAEGLWKTSHEGQAAYILPPIAHLTNGPCGMTFNPGVTAFPDSYDDNFFIVNYRGSAANSQIESFALEPAGAGFSLGKNGAFVKGIAATDIDWGTDGKLYISDFIGGWTQPGSGRILTVFDQEIIDSPELTEIKTLFRKGFSSLTPDRLTELLGHKDLRVRQRAQFALAGKDSLEALAHFTTAAENNNPLTKRLHALWGLGQLASHKPQALATIASHLSDPENEVRANAARTLGNHPNALSAYRVSLEHLLADSSPRVASLAALALANHGSPDSISPALVLLEQLGGSDPYLRHAATMILAKSATAKSLGAMQDHSSHHVRLAAVVALRRQASSHLQKFFSDTHPLVRDEAIRAAYDLNLIDTYPAIARSLQQLASEVDESFVSHPIIARRAIYSAWKLGQEDNLQQIASLVTDFDIDRRVRRDALISLLNWNSPPIADPVTAFVHPLPADRIRLTPSILSTLQPFFDASPADDATNSLMPHALKLVDQESLPLATESLVRYAQAETLSDSSRSQALKLLAKRDHPNWDLWKKTLVSLSSAESVTVRSTSREILLDIAPDIALGLLIEVISQEKSTRQEKQFAFRTLGKSDSPVAIKTLVSALQSLTKTGNTNGIGLDIVMASELSQQADVQAALSSFRATLPSGDPLAEWKALCANGGDASRGRTLFYNHGAAQCQRCHAIDGSGGNAGPELTAIGNRFNSNYLLRAIITPNSEVAAGYGIGSITTTNGETHSGFIMPDDEHGNSVVKIGDKLRTVPKDTIANSTQPISSMPSMSGLLKKDEVRDIVAFLSSLKEDRTDDKHK